MNDDKVGKFLAELKLSDSVKFEILQLIRTEVKQYCPNLDERMMYGGIMFSAEDKDLGGVFIRKKHISVEFTAGYIMDDPDNKLEGSGKFRRHIKIKERSEIVEKDLIFFIRQMQQQTGTQK